MATDGNDSNERQASTGVILDLRGIAPTAERLVDFISTIPTAVGPTLVTRWGDLFPWSFDERLRSSSSYPEEVIDAMCKVGARAGAELIPAADVVTGLNELCHTAPYRRVATFLHDAVSFSSNARGAIALATEVVQDLIALYLSPAHFYLGGECAGRISSGIADFVGTFLRPVIESAVAAATTPVVHEACLARGAGDELAALAGSREIVVVVGLDELSDATARARRFVDAGFRTWLSVPAYREFGGEIMVFPRTAPTGGSGAAAGAPWNRVLFDCRTSTSFYESGLVLLEEYASVFSGGRDPRAERLSRKLGALRNSVEECWRWLRRLKETIVAATYDPRRRNEVGSGMRRLADLVRLHAGTARLHAHEVVELARGRVDVASLERSLFEKLSPVEEELSNAEERIRQLSVFPG